MNFNVHAAVARIERSEVDKEIIAYHVDIKVNCHECGKPFEWVGLPNGFSHYQPTVSINGQELRAPLIPEGGKVTEGLAGFKVTHQVFGTTPPTTQ